MKIGKEGWGREDEQQSTQSGPGRLMNCPQWPLNQSLHLMLGPELVGSHFFPSSFAAPNECLSIWTASVNPAEFCLLFSRPFALFDLNGERRSFWFN